MALTAKQLARLRRSEPVHGNRLAEAVRLSETSQVDIAEATGLLNTYISDVSRGRYQTVTVKNAHKLAEYFGCSIEDLFPAKAQVA